MWSTRYLRPELAVGSKLNIIHHHSPALSGSTAIMNSYLVLSALMIAVATCHGAVHSPAHTVGHSSHVATVELKQRLSKQLLQSMSIRKKFDDGFTFDVCRKLADCRGNRLCVHGDLTTSCSPSDRLGTCICIGEVTQLCDKCKECEHYPHETCLGDPDDGEFESGLCGSSFTAFEGILEEIGCANTATRALLPIRADFA